MSRYIVHFDGDAFFVSCEQVRKPWLKGKPVVTGQERGIASALSYEAKKIGVTRGMPIRLLKKLYPQVTVLPGDYRLYSIFAGRTKAILERYSMFVEQYSIDECFVDITAECAKKKIAPEVLALRMKEVLELELGVTFGAGLAGSKVLAKIASKFRKPGGFTYIKQGEEMEFLHALPIGKVWGIGSATTIALSKYGIRTAGDLATKPLRWIRSVMPKPLRSTYRELQGTSIFPVATSTEIPKSLMRTRMFPFPTSNWSYIWSEFVINTETACAKARSTGIVAQSVSAYIKTQAFRYMRVHIPLPKPSCDPIEILSIVRSRLQALFDSKTQYRASGIVLHELIEAPKATESLFEPTDPRAQVFEAIGKLQERYGQSSVILGSSLKAHIQRKHSQLPALERLYLPVLGRTVEP